MCRFKSCLPSPSSTTGSRKEQRIWSTLPLERPRACATNQQAAIIAAWQRVQPGDRLIVIVEIGDEALTVLQTLEEMAGDGGRYEMPLLERAVVG